MSWRTWLTQMASEGLSITLVLLLLALLVLSGCTHQPPGDGLWLTVS